MDIFLTGLLVVVVIVAFFVFPIILSVTLEKLGKQFGWEETKAKMIASTVTGCFMWGSLVLLVIFVIWYAIWVENDIQRMRDKPHWRESRVMEKLDEEWKEYERRMDKSA